MPANCRRDLIRRLKFNNGDRLPFPERSQVKMKEDGEGFVQHSDTCTRHYFQLEFLTRTRTTELIY